jgi:hypothetical protein
MQEHPRCPLSSSPITTASPQLPFWFKKDGSKKVIAILLEFFSFFENFEN